MTSLHYCIYCVSGFKNKKFHARSGKTAPMSFHGLWNFRLISRNNNFHRAPSVFRSDQQTASLTSFLSEEVIKWTAVHRLTVPAAPSPRPPWQRWPSQVCRVSTLFPTSTQAFIPQLQVKRRLFSHQSKLPFFFLVCFNGLIITVLHDCKELFFNQLQTGMSYWDR